MQAGAHTHNHKTSKTYYYNPKITALSDKKVHRQRQGGETHDTQSMETYKMTHDDQDMQNKASPLKQRQGQSDPNDDSSPLPRRTHHERGRDTRGHIGLCYHTNSQSTVIQV